MFWGLFCVCSCEYSIVRTQMPFTDMCVCVCVSSVQSYEYIFLCARTLTDIYLNSNFK